MNNHAKVSAATWVSNGPVQINVGRDFHIHGATAALDIPDDCVLPSGNSEPDFLATLFRLWSAAKLFVSAVWFVAKVFFWVVIGLLVLCAVLPAMAIALSLWLIARIAELPLTLERKLGGGRTRLVYVPWLQQSRHRVPTPLDSQEFDSSDVELLEPGISDSSRAARRAPSEQARTSTGSAPPLRRLACKAQLTDNAAKAAAMEFPHVPA